ncbi:hypothetical protein ECANGB1_623 [Enterospora canceri]|nr:hypothetical protein ECANGB1_623 [Enterospora canceri]
MDNSVVKDDINTLRKMPEFTFKELNLTRNLTPSNSHAHVYKKFENASNNSEDERQPNGFTAYVSEPRVAGSTPPNANNLFFNNPVHDKKDKK